MLYLRTLGGLRLDASVNGDAEIVTQRRPLALLAYLAAAGELGVARDKLLSVFWPEKDIDRARGALKQLVFALRRETHEDEVIVGREQLRLNPAVIQSDIEQFNAAMSASDGEAMLNLYRGPFLDGVHISGTADFEEWVDRERARLLDVFQREVTALANRAEAVADYDRATRTWRRLADTDPLSSRFASGVIRSLSMSGGREAAIQYGEKYVQTVSRELGCSADASVSALLDALRLARSAKGFSEQTGVPLPPIQTVLPTLVTPLPSGAGPDLVPLPARNRLALTAVAAIIVAGLGVVATRLALKESRRPHTIGQAYEARAARWEGKPRGRVFIETPINATGERELDSIGSSLTEMYFGFAKSAAHPIPVDSVKAIERLVSSQPGLAGPRQRLAHTDAQINVMTVLRLEGDSVYISVSLQRLVDARVPRYAWDTTPAGRKIPARTEKVLESWPIISTAGPRTKAIRAVINSASALGQALRAMRSCDVRDHVDPKLTPWCWRKENESDLVPGYFETSHVVRTASR